MDDHTIEQRFWAKVEKTETCWIWTAGTNGHGYGDFWPAGKTKVYAHRFAYELVNGSCPKGLRVDHICHNPGCVRPDHLRLATHKQNMEHRTGPNRNGGSGKRGVSWHAGRWEARVQHWGEHVYLGRFDTIEEAEAAVIAKRQELFTHNDLDRQ